MCCNTYDYQSMTRRMRHNMYPFSLIVNWALNQGKGALNSQIVQSENLEPKWCMNELFLCCKAGYARPENCA